MNFFRRHLDSKITKIIALLIVAVFVGWEFSSSFFKNQNSWLIKVGSIEYKPKDWEETYKALTKDPMSAQEAIANPQYAKKRVLEEMIRNAIILQEAERIGFSVSDKMVASEIVHMKIFKGEDGKFDKNVLEKILKINHLTEADFIKSMKEQILRNQLMDIFYNTSGILSTQTYDLLVKILTAQHKISLYKIPSINDKVEYTDEQLKKYLQENQSMFTTNKEANITTVSFNSSILAKGDITPSEEEIQKHHEEHSIIEPEKRLIHQIVISSHNEAKEILNKIKSKKITYDEAAKIHSKQQLIPYEIGPFVSEGFDEEISKVVFNLPKNGISDLVQTPLGWHIFRVGNVIEERKKHLSEVRSAVVQELTDKKIAQQMHAIVKNVMIDIENGMSIQAIAAKYNLIAKDSIQKSDENTDDEISGVMSKKFLQAAFSEDQNGIKLVSSRDKKAFVLIETKNIIPGKLLEFEVVKPSLIKAYVENQNSIKTKQYAKDFREKILKNKLEKDKNIQKTQIQFNRMKQESGLPACVHHSILKMYESSILDGVTIPCEEKNDFFFAVLGDFNFDVAISKEEKMSMKQVIHTIYNEMIFKEFLDSLKEKYRVELSENFIKYMNE